MTNSLPSDSAAGSQSKKLSLPTKLAFGVGDLGSAITANILVFYLSPFLTDVALLAPGMAGMTQLIGKFWDAVNDPIVGVLSDRTKSKWGRRYPWMLLGAIPLGIFFFLQWIVPFPESNQWGLFWYYTLISILFNAFYTVVNLPYTALTPELTEDYDERTSLNSFRFTFSIGGSILSAAIALLFFTVIPVRSQAYLFMGLACALLSVIPIYLCVWGTKARVEKVAAEKPEAEEPVSIPFFQQLKIIINNKPFLFVVGIYLFSWLSVQLTAAIIPYFVVSRMRLEDGVIALLIFAVQGTALGMLFVWSKISERVGKKAVYMMGMSLWMIAQAGLFFLQPNQVTLMYILAVIAGFGVSTAYLIPWSMLPDVIELDELNTGQRREGIYYSFIVFLQKICLGIAVFLVLQSLQWAGYIKPTAEVKVPVQPEAVIFAIRVAIGPLPTVILVAGMILAYFYPITKEVHAEILLKLRERRMNEAE